MLPAGAALSSHNASEGQSGVLTIFGSCVGDGFTTVEIGAEAPWNGLRA